MGLSKSAIPCDKCGHDKMWFYGRTGDKFLRLICDLCHHKMHVKGTTYLEAKVRQDVQCQNAQRSRGTEG